MDLDELKSLINERMERVHAAKSSADIALLLGKKTQSVVGKIKRSLILEMIVSAVFTCLCIGVAVFATYSSIRIYFAIFAFICVLFLPLLYVLLNKIKNLSNTTLPVKSNLQALAKLIKEYTKRYFQLTMALIPITLLISFFLGYTDENLYNPEINGSFISILTGSSQKIALLVGYIVFAIGMYYFTRWFLRKLYGDYVSQLEVLIKELEEQQ